MSDLAKRAKKIIKVEFPNLKDPGFGWNGEFTREKWQEECRTYFLQGKENFLTWQKSWEKDINITISDVSFECKVIYNDGSVEVVFHKEKLVPYCLDFSGQKFDDILFATDYEFMQLALFTGTEFFEIVFFENSIFNQVIYFSGAIFHKLCYFDEVKFIKHAYFDNTTFNRSVNFTETFFGAYTNFNNAELNSYANFEDATFIKHVSFNYANLNGYAQFSKVKFLSQCWFKNTNFNGAVNFENAEFKNVGHFEDAKFNTEFPNFLGVDNSKTLLMFSCDENFNKNDVTLDSVKKLAQLKRLADEQGQTDQALMFNAFELNAKRAQAREKAKHLKLWQKINNADYWFANATAGFRIFSDYGRSFFEPLKWYLALLGVTFYLTIAHAVYFTNKECPNEYANIFSYLWREQIQCVPVKPKDNETPIVLSGWRAAVEYTSYRASGILDFADSDKQTIAISNRLFNQPIEPPWMRAWGIFKGMASIALLFLAALGLRNKYRIK